jgi:hypothetical protein
LRRGTTQAPAPNPRCAGRARVLGSGGTGVRPGGALARSVRPSVRPSAAVHPSSRSHVVTRLRRSAIYPLGDEFGPRAEPLLINDA